MLGGVELPSKKGLLGHSDGDVLLHALADAVLGALGKPDIGCFFPDTDKKIKGIAGGLILKRALDEMAKEKFGIANADVVLVAEEPKLAPHYERIRANVARLAGISVKNVGVKAKTAEMMGPVGKGGAIACMAVVLLEQKKTVRRPGSGKKVVK